MTQLGTVGEETQLFYPVQPGRGPEIKERAIVYPESDGKPMGETGFHVRAILHLYSALTQFFQKRDDVYIAADMFLYYQEGKPHVKKAPDVMVIKGVQKHERRIFKTWEEQASPCVIFEVTSASSMIEDLMIKSKTYAELGVQEYFLFDPLREYIPEALKGFRLEENEYAALALDDDGRIYSAELGVLLSPEGEILRVIDPQTGMRVPSLEEAMGLAAQEAQRAERLAARLRAIGIDPDASV